MSATSYGWLVLAFPLAGTLIVSLGWRVLPGRLAGVDRQRGDSRRVPVGDRGAGGDPGSPGGGARGRRLRVDLRLHRRLQGRPRDPDRPAVGVHVPRGQRSVVLDPRLLRGLHGRGPRLRALLRLPQLLRVLDAGAGPRRELHPADRRLGLRGRRVLPADLLLVPAQHRHPRRDQGLRDQRDRRRRPGGGRFPAAERDRRARLRRRVLRRRGGLRPRTTRRWCSSAC